MNIQKPILTVNTFRTENLGLKLLIATHKGSGNSFVVVGDVNPYGLSFKEHVEPGDILLEINGIPLTDSSSLLTVQNSLSVLKNQEIQLKFQKRGAFDGSDVFHRCNESFCTELCKYWNVIGIKKKVSTAISVPDNINVLSERPPLSSVGSCSDVSQFHKKKSIDEFDDNNKSKRIHATGVSGKISVHQKAIPMKAPSRKSSFNKTAKLKPKYNENTLREQRSHVIAQPQPQFIQRTVVNRPPYEKRSDNLSNLKQAKSLTNLSEIGIVKKGIPSDSSSDFSSDHDLPSKFIHPLPDKAKEAPVSIAITSRENLSFPIPRPRYKPTNLTVDTTAVTTNDLDKQPSNSFVTVQRPEIVGRNPKHQFERNSFHESD